MIALYPGSFDPVTYGHLDIIERASQLFDKLIIVIMENDEKKPAFSSSQRKELLENTKLILSINFKHYYGVGIQPNYNKYHFL